MSHGGSQETAGPNYIFYILTITKFFPDEPPNLKTTYKNLVSSHNQPKLSTSTQKKLTTYGLEETIFKNLWKLKLRPRAKNFFYLWLRNSTPIAQNEPCPLCAMPQHQNHLWGECPSTKDIVGNTKPGNDIPGFVILFFSVWLTFCHFQHNETPTTFFYEFFQKKIQNEKKRAAYFNAQ